MTWYHGTRRGFLQGWPGMTVPAVGVREGVDMSGVMVLTVPMTNTATTKCQHDDLMVSGGVVRCADCLTFFHDHADSAPRPGLVAKNQER